MINRDKLVLEDHALQLQELGLVEAEFYPGGFEIRRLTSAGHDFLENAVHDDLWNRAKEKAGGFSFKVLEQALLKLSTEAVLNLL